MVSFFLFFFVAEKPFTVTGRLVLSLILADRIGGWYNTPYWLGTAWLIADGSFIGVPYWLGPVWLIADGSFIGVGAGKFLGVRKMYARISPKLPEKLLGHFLCNFHVILGASFSIKAHCAPLLSNQSKFGAIYARIFMEFAQIFRDFSKVFRNFAQILRDFARIFTKSKL